MLPGFLLSLREGLEAALIIGILIGALVKMSREYLRSTIWFGVAAAIGLSLLAALLLHALGVELEGDHENIFEGFTLLMASALLTWMIFWMGRQARYLKSDLENGVRVAVLHGGRQALFSLAFISVLREGVELALYLTAAGLTTNGTQVLAGSLLGLVSAVLLGFALFTSLIRLDLRRFFSLTSLILILFAAGMVAHGAREFTGIGWIPALVPHIWDTNYILNEQSALGQVMSSLFGYSGTPSLMELIIYLGYFLIIGLSRLLNRNAPARAEST